MKIKNDYLLFKVKQIYIPQMDIYCFQCSYTNGVQEITLEVLFGQEIKTILPYERMD